VQTVSNACASGAVAVEMAREMLVEGVARRIVLFGLDTLSQFVVTGFHALNALSPLGARPFDAARDGLTPGECAAAAVLTMREVRPGDIIIAGAGSSNDANHRTGPSRTGDGLLLASQAALRDAGFPPSEVGAVKCHGTGTVYNDAMEAKALTALFGDRIPPCASVKGALGHTSGAGSLLEILIAAECLRRRSLPPTAGYRAHGVEEPLPLSSAAQPVIGPSMPGTAVPGAAVLCLSAGFGGINAAVVLREAA
jgi:3-oxoacyl-(acyl-carrier-protein) synthase